MADLRTNLLYFGDNLEWLRKTDRFPEDSVDLIYLDPPFNSNRNYNVLFKENDVRDSEAQMHAFEDTWAWDREGRVQETFDDYCLQAPMKAADTLKALVAVLGRNDVTAYLTMMAPRLLVLRRVLRKTGTIYVHCDPTASHYLKVVMDSIFDARNFRNELIWERSIAKGDARLKFGANHDSILAYGGGGRVYFSPVFADVDEAYLGRFKLDDADGRGPYRLAPLDSPNPRPNLTYPYKGFQPPVKGWRVSLEVMEQLDSEGRLAFPRSAGGRIARKHYLAEQSGRKLGDVFIGIPPLQASDPERLGYPTQKPLALLERIIAASSKPGDVVLDPFCGCGTAVHAAQKLGREWIGIDITPLATDLIRRRMEDAFPVLAVPIEGWPADFAGAKSLAEQPDKYHFQDWAVIQSGGRPAGGVSKKGADRGIDGIIPFIDGQAGPKRGVISVKAGNTGPTHIRDLAGVVSADADAEFGVFICLNEPTKAMIAAANEQGTWTSTFDGENYPKMQILSAQDLINEKPVRMPHGSRSRTFAEAPRERKTEGKQGGLI